MINTVYSTLSHVFCGSYLYIFALFNAMSDLILSTILILSNAFKVIALKKMCSIYDVMHNCWSIN